MIYGFNDNKEKVDVDELLEEASPSVKPDISRVHAPGTVYFSEDGGDPNELFGGFWVEDTTGGYQPEGYPMDPQGKKYIKTGGVEAYAVYDSDTFTLTFFRDEEDKYTDGQEIGSKTYYTGVETIGPQDDVPWYSHNEGDYYTVIFEDHICPISTAYWFYAYTNPNNLRKIINGEKLHTQDVTHMHDMFYGCVYIEEIPIKFDTRSVISTDSMFYGCSALEYSPVFIWYDENKIENMSGMYVQCESINNIEMPTGRMPNLITVGAMFDGCTYLTSIYGLDTLDVSNVTDMAIMFSGCSALTELHLEWWDTSNVTRTHQMFMGCSSLKAIYVTDTWDLSNATSSGNMFTFCNNLVGGNGTTYSSTYRDKTYARIDVSGTPGYLTESVAYARWDNSSNKELSFFRDAAGKYTNGQVSGNYTFWTDIETSTYSTYNDCPWYSKRSSVKRCSINGKIRPISTAYWFYGMNSTQFTEFTSGDSHLIDTSRTVNMEYMFYNCTYLSRIHLFGVDTSNVTDMQYMFYNCSRLWNIIISPEPSLYWYKLTESRQNSINMLAWDTSSVTDMKYMFYNCNVLGYLNLSNWDTFNVANMESMFRSCYRMYTIYVSDKWNTDSVTSSADSADMFSGCQYLTGGWGTTFNSLYKDKRYARIDDPQANRPGYLTYLPGPAKEAYAVYDSSDTSLTFFRDDVGRYTNGQVDGNKTYYTGIENTGHVNPPWYSNRADVTTVNFRDVIKPISCCSWFSGMENLIDIVHLKYLNTSNVTDMSNMFKGCNIITHIDVSGFDTSQVTIMYGMFRNCTSLISLDLSMFNTENVTSMSNLVCGCDSLNSVNLSGFDTSRVYDMSGMFQGCHTLNTVDISSFDTSSVTTMLFMFYFCYNLTSIYVSSTGWQCSRVINSDYMFTNATQLPNFDPDYDDKTKAISTADGGYLTYVYSNLSE